MIGDLKLTALKGRLSTKGIKMELAGEGVLLCWSSKADDDELNHCHQEEGRRQRRTGRICNRSVLHCTADNV